MLTNKKIQRLHDSIQRSLDSIPDQSASGESNAHDKRLMRLWLADLGRILAGQGAQTDAVASWISGDDDYFLSDFLS